MLRTKEKPAVWIVPSAAAKYVTSVRSPENGLYVAVVGEELVGIVLVLKKQVFRTHPLLYTTKHIVRTFHLSAVAVPMIVASTLQQPMR
jgi:hypothetical protein